MVSLGIFCLVSFKILLVWILPWLPGLERCSISRLKWRESMLNLRLLWYCYLFSLWTYLSEYIKNKKIVRKKLFQPLKNRMELPIMVKYFSHLKLHNAKYPQNFLKLIFLMFTLNLMQSKKEKKTQNSFLNHNMK